MTVTPAEITLIPDASASGVLIIANETANAVRNIGVTTAASDASVRGTLDEPVPATLAPGGSISIGFTVRRVSEGSAQDVAVRFVARYTEMPARDATRGVGKVAVAAFTVKAAASPALLEAKVESRVETINENRPGEATLVITNPRDAVIELRSLQVIAPNAVTVTLTCPTGDKKLSTPAGARKLFRQCRLVLPPRFQATLHIDLETDESVAPGPRTLLIRVGARGPARRAAATTVATYGFSVDVFAESDILKSIGVPVFLLLPGIIILLTAWTAIRLATPWRRLLAGAKMDTPVQAATFTAVAGLGISLAVAVLYPALTRTFVPGYERDYLKAYGFRDFYYVFGYGFSIAAAAWVAAWLLAWSIPVVRWLFIPSPNDDARAMLRKIGLRGIVSGRTVHPKVSVPVAGRNLGGVSLGDRPEAKALVAPRIIVTLKGDDAGRRLGAIEAKATEGHAFGLWREVQKAVRSGAQVNYHVGDVRRPQLVDRAQVEHTGQNVPIVEATE